MTIDTTKLRELVVRCGWRYWLVDGVAITKLTGD